MKYFFIILVIASKIQACSTLKDLIYLYNGKNYESAYIELTNRCGDQISWDAHDAYWQGKICEANSKNDEAIENYEFVLRIKKIQDLERKEGSQLFFETNLYPDTFLRLANLYRKNGNKENYNVVVSQLKNMNTHYYNKLNCLNTQADRNSITKIVNRELKKDRNSDRIDVIVGISIIGDFAVAQTDDEGYRPSPMIRYYLRFIDGKWKIILKDYADGRDINNYDEFEKHAKEIPKKLLDYNVYTEKNK